MRSTQRDGESPGSVLGRSTALLACFGEDSRTLGVSELSRRSGLARSTAHRLAEELTRLRLLERTDDPPAYRLGTWLFELGALVPTHRTLGEAAQPIMEDLREATHHRIHLAVLDGVEVVYVKILGQTPGRTIASRVGGRLPAHATGVGKVLLAYSSAATVRARIDAGLPALMPRTIVTPGGLARELRRIRTVGMALDLEESTPGVSCVAAPVFGSDRTVRAGLSVTGPTRSIDPATLGPAVRTAALTLTRALRASGL